MMKQQPPTLSVPKSSRFEHAADICFDVLRNEAAHRVETDLAKDLRPMAQPSVENDASCVVERRSFPRRSNPRGPHTAEPFKPDDHRRMFPLDVASFSVPHEVFSRANGSGQ